MESSLRVLLALAALLVVTGCAGGAGPGEEELYVFLPESMDSPFWVDAKAGMDAEAEELGVTAQFVGPLKKDTASQVTFLEEAIARKPAGIAISAEDTEEVRDAVARAREAGIPVISWVSPLPDSEVMAHVGADDRAAGEEAAKSLARTLDGEGQIALLTTAADAPGFERRTEGFEKGLEAYPNIEVVYVGITGEDLEAIPSKVSYLLQTRPEIDALFGVTGPEIPGAAEAVRDFDSCGEVRVAGFEATPEAIELMQAGCVQLLVSQKPYEMTAEALRLLTNLERGEAPADVYSGATLISPRDLDEFLKKGSY